VLTVGSLLCFAARAHRVHELNKQVEEFLSACCQGNSSGISWGQLHRALDSGGVYAIAGDFATATCHTTAAIQRRQPPTRVWLSEVVLVW
jgi:hypothetical protein